MNEVTKGFKSKSNYNKSGKQGKRKEQRRLEAIERQVRRVTTLESNLVKTKDTADVQQAIVHAQHTLQQIRGGINHGELQKRFAVKPVTESVKASK